MADEEAKQAKELARQAKRAAIRARVDAARKAQDDEKARRNSGVTANVTVPPGMPPGSQFAIRLPNGKTLEVTVPPGAEAGTKLEIRIPTATADELPSPKKAEEEQQQQQQQQPQQPKPPLQKMMSAKIAVPAGAKPGDAFGVQLPSGRTVEVRVPEGAVEGGSFTLEVPAEQAVAPGTSTPVPSDGDEEEQDEPGAAVSLGAGAVMLEEDEVAARQARNEEIERGEAARKEEEEAEEAKRADIKARLAKRVKAQEDAQARAVEERAAGDAAAAAALAASALDDGGGSDGDESKETDSLLGGAAPPPAAPAARHATFNSSTWRGEAVDCRYGGAEVEVRPGRKLNVIEYGNEASGVTLFFLHGACGSAAQFEAQLRFFAPQYRVVAYDAYGCGSSPAPNEWSAYSTAALLDDAEAVFERFKAKKNIVIGHAFGAVLAMKLALRLQESAPACVPGIVLLAAAPAAPGTATYLLPEFVLNCMKAGLARSFAAHAFDPDTEEEPLQVTTRADLEKNPMHMTRAFYRQLQWTAEEELGALTVTPMLLTGWSDGLAPPSEMAKLKTAMTGVSAIAQCITAAGHMLMQEQPEEVNTYIASFIGDCLSGGKSTKRAAARKAVKQEHEKAEGFERDTNITAGYASGRAKKA